MKWSHWDESFVEYIMQQLFYAFLSCHGGNDTSNHCGKGVDAFGSSSGLVSYPRL